MKKLSLFWGHGIWDRILPCFSSSFSYCLRCIKYYIFSTIVFWWKTGPNIGKSSTKGNALDIRSWNKHCILCFLSIFHNHMKLMNNFFLILKSKFPGKVFLKLYFTVCISLAQKRIFMEISVLNVNFSKNVK